MTTQLNTAFAIKIPAQVIAPNNSQAQPTLPVSVRNIGVGGVTGTPTNIPATDIANGLIRVAPAADGSQHYMLPQAAQLLAVYGQNQTSYAPNIATGSMIKLKVVNSGIFPAFIKGNITGSDATAIIAHTGSGIFPSALSGITGAAITPQVTGSTNYPAAHATDLFMLWTNVAGSVTGMTGSYTIFN
jgi:hypothetical protein